MGAVGFDPGFYLSSFTFPPAYKIAARRRPYIFINYLLIYNDPYISSTTQESISL